MGRFSRFRVYERLVDAFLGVPFYGLLNAIIDQVKAIIDQVFDIGRFLPRRPSRHRPRNRSGGERHHHPCTLLRQLVLHRAPRLEHLSLVAYVL